MPTLNDTGIVLQAENSLLLSRIEVQRVPGAVSRGLRFFLQDPLR